MKRAVITGALALLALPSLAEAGQINAVGV
jgi:hypothetical protein